MGVFLWGALIAGGGAFLINTIFGLGVYLFTGSEAATGLTSSILFAPVIEEVLKGLAVLLVFFLARNHFDSILDGIVYAGVAALGFAATENAFYIYTYGFLEEGWAGFWDLALIRIGLVGWQHPFYTAFFGIGLATARVNRSAIVKGVAPVIGLFCSIAAHALHNFLASFFPGVGGQTFTTIVDWTGWLLMLIFIVIISRVEKQDLAVYLKDEVQLGTPNPGAIPGRHLCGENLPGENTSSLQGAVPADPTCSTGPPAAWQSRKSCSSDWGMRRITPPRLKACVGRF